MAEGVKAGSLFVGVGADTEDFDQSMDNAITRIFSLEGAVLAAGATLGFFASKAIGDSIQAMSNFETAMAGVEKVTGASEAVIKNIGEGLRNLSVELGANVEELGKFAEAAARAGVRGEENILAFTETIEKLQIATELSGEQIADTFARLIGFLGLSASEAETVASTINELGNQLPTDAERIIDATSRMAADFRSLGLTAPQILGLSAATSTLRESSNRAATRLRRVAQEMMSPSRLSEIASLFGTTGDKLEQLRRQAPIGLMLALSKVLNSDSEQAGQLADVLGVRVVSELRNVGLRSDRVREALELANKEFGRTQSLNEEVAIFLDTLNKKWDQFQSIIHSTAIEIGQFFKPAVLGILGLLTGLADDFRKLNRATEGAFGAFILLTGAIFGATIAVSSFAQIFRVTFGESFRKAIVRLGRMATKITTLVAAVFVIGQAWKDNWFGIRDTTEAVFNFIGPKIGALIDSATSFATKVVQSFNSVDKATGGLISGFLKFTALSASIGVVGNFLRKVFSKVAGFLRNSFIKRIVFGNEKLRLFQKWIGRLITRIPGLSKIIRLVGGSFLRLAGIVGIIITVAELLWITWRENIDNIRGFVMKNLRQIGVLFQKHFGEILNQARKTANFWRKVFIRAGEMLMERFGPLIKTIAGVFVAVFIGVKEFFQVWGDDIVAILKFVLDTAFGIVKFSINLIATVIKTFLALLRGDWKAAWGFVKEFFINTFNGIVSFLEKWVRGFIKGIGNAIDQIIQAFIDFGDWLIHNSFIQDTFNAVVSYIKNAGKEIVKGAFDALISAVKDIWKGLKEWLSGGKGFIEKTIKSVTGWLTETGKSLVEDAFDKLVGAAEDALNLIDFSPVKSAIGGVISKAKKAVSWLKRAAGLDGGNNNGDDTTDSPGEATVTPGAGGGVVAFQGGGFVSRTGMALVHEGERVIPEAGKEPLSSRGKTIRVTIGSINASTREGGRQAAIGFEQELKSNNIRLQGN